MTMKITWTESGAECSLAVYWRSEDGNSVNSRFATLVDLKRASEVAGMLHDYVDRDEAFESEQKLKVRLAVLEAEHAAYLDALAIEGLRPTTVMIGIESLKSLLAGAHANRLDADARGDAAIARAEKADRDLTTARERIADLEGERSIAAAIRKSEDATWNSLTARAADSEDRASELARENDALRKRIADLEAEHDLANGVNRRAAQTIVDCIGSIGPEDADSAAERIVSRVLKLEAERDGARSVISVVDKVLTEEARHPQSIDVVARVRGLAAQANGLAKIIETRGNIIAELEGALAESKRDFALANEAYDELQARFDEPVASAERIALLEALEPHDPNAARDAASMKREHEAAMAVLGARDGEDLLAAARRAVCLADVYRAHYRRAVISNFTADRAMTEGLAECERLRARIAELEASMAERESLRDLIEKSAEARLSCGLYIPREGLIEVGVGRGGQTYADTPQNAVWEFERLLRERVGGGKARPAT